MITKSREDTVIGRYVYVAIYDHLYLPLDVYHIKEPRLGTELKDDTDTRMLDRLFISERREDSCLFYIILPKNRQNLSFEKLN
jgi:hypothetical protein